VPSAPVAPGKKTRAWADHRRRRRCC
jgi:hypothetical protein